MEGATQVYNSNASHINSLLLQHQLLSNGRAALGLQDLQNAGNFLNQHHLAPAGPTVDTSATKLISLPPFKTLQSDYNGDTWAHVSQHMGNPLAVLTSVHHSGTGSNTSSESNLVLSSSMLNSSASNAKSSESLLDVRSLSNAGSTFGNPTIRQASMINHNNGQSAADHLYNYCQSLTAQQQSAQQQQVNNLLAADATRRAMSSQLDMHNLTSQLGALGIQRSTSHINPSGTEFILEPSSGDAQALGLGGLSSMELLSSGSLPNLLGGSTELSQSGSTSSSASLYVKNLPPDNERDAELFLYQKFAPHGALLSCKVKTDPATGKCRGVGFVNYVETSCALRAMQQLHGTRTPEGRQLHITLQAPRAVRAAAAAAAAASASATASVTSPTAGMGMMSEHVTSCSPTNGMSASSLAAVSPCYLTQLRQQA